MAPHVFIMPGDDQFSSTWPQSARHACLPLPSRLASRTRSSFYSQPKYDCFSFYISRSNNIIDINKLSTYLYIIYLLYTVLYNGPAGRAERGSIVNLISYENRIYGADDIAFEILELAPQRATFTIICWLHIESCLYPCINPFQFNRIFMKHPVSVCISSKAACLPRDIVLLFKTGIRLGWWWRVESRGFRRVTFLVEKAVPPPPHLRSTLRWNQPTSQAWRNRAWLFQLNTQKQCCGQQ